MILIKYTVFYTNKYENGHSFSLFLWVEYHSIEAEDSFFLLCSSFSFSCPSVSNTDLPLHPFIDTYFSRKDDGTWVKYF